MSNSIEQILIDAVNEQRKLDAAFCNQEVVSTLPHEADLDGCPRLEYLISGSADIKSVRGSEKLLAKLHSGSVLFTPADIQFDFQFHEKSLLLSLGFYKQQIIIKLIEWNAEHLTVLEKISVLRRGPRVGAFILQSLQEVMWRQEDKQTAAYLIKSLLSSSLYLLQNPMTTLPRRKSFFEEIRSYIDENYYKDLTRDSVAKEFLISSTYLSHLFQKEAELRFNEYLNFIRLEKAKFMLKRHDVKVKDVAIKCGFKDSNYFCRLFKEKTDRSPSEYRAQYCSKHDDV